MRKTILSAFLFLTLTATSRAEVYIVKKGDTLTTIAQKLGLPLEKLKYANPGIKSTDLSIGQKILIPQIKTTTSNSQTASNVITSKVYIVQKGDNAFNISKKLGCSLDQLKNLNPNINLSNLNVGDRIIVPNNTKIVSNTQLTNIYIVKSGDTASTIANKYNVSLSELEKLNPQLNLSNINIGDRIILPNNVLNDIKNTQIAAQKKTFKNENFYTVEPGDTLTAISQKTGINMNIIKSLNPSIDWSNLQIGEEIVLRPSLQKEQTKLSNNDIYPKENQDINYIKYTVTPGDTLFSIAKTFSTTINELKKINSLTSNNLSIGQTILVPPKIIAIKSMQNNNSSNKTPTYQAKNNTDQQQNNDQSVALDNSETNNYSLYLDHYTVQKGDTLYQIAKKFNISVDDIVALNNLPNKEITVGEILLIPNNNKNIASIQKNYSTSEYSLINKENPLSERLVKYAKLFVGTPYQWGGTNLETGVDCSGFVQDVFAKFHIDLPRTSSEQFNVGKPVSLSDIKPGDLLFFQTYPGTYPSHVGIYIGDDKFISALNQNTGVVISPLDGYFLKRFVGARRVLPSNQKFNDNTGNRSG
ncbi:peptidoglycan endopeptidase LytF [Desulfurella multipotens]|uniref:Peptidoglycan endopeptidase LytF n=1 Tax=Desulfurella multipotens TaxID=79269 RepID=A0A1G6HKF1_9BACT|nr:LysM peptidoglycan-binding domain-containing protein [Desulfurella multipotens]SDB94684.1 peptidoglycan endopeptidase LytF [Desulfurella multipotens]